MYPGVKINLNSNNKEVQEIVSVALLSVDQQAESGKTHLLSKILNASKQVKKENCYYFMEI